MNTAGNLPIAVLYRQFICPHRYDELMVCPYRYDELMICPYRYDELMICPYRYDEVMICPYRYDELMICPCRYDELIIAIAPEVLLINNTPPGSSEWIICLGDYVDNSFTALGSSDTRKVRLEL